MVWVTMVVGVAMVGSTVCSVTFFPPRLQPSWIGLQHGSLHAVDGIGRTSQPMVHFAPTHRLELKVLPAWYSLQGRSGKTTRMIDVPLVHVLAVSGSGVWFTHRQYKKARGLITSACATCGYDLRGIAGDVCPECGTAKMIRDAGEVSPAPPR